MPNTRKKVIKTVYKDEVSESETGDFSDSGSEAQFSEQPSSEDEEIEEQVSSADEFINTSIKKRRKKQPIKTKQRIFSKEILCKINKQTPAETEENEIPLSLFSVKDLTEADKLLPSVLNLSESDSSDDEAPKPKKAAAFIPYSIQEQEDSDNEAKEEYTDVWATNTNDNSADIAKKTFMELERHKTTIENTKASIQSYVPRSSIEQEKESKVTDLLALGEDIVPTKKKLKMKQRPKKNRDDSESEVEDWEEVKESKAIPQQGLQLVVALPDSICRKSKKIDVEMMMKRKINRVKKEHQVFMHKVHVLCWIGHGNYVNRVLNDQEIMAAVIAMVPKGCYPEDRLNMKYVEQIAVWFKDKLTLKEDKNENKFRPKAPPLRNILLDQIKKRTVSARKYSVFIFVAMLRALGLQCRIMFNFVTVPIRPPSSELCSLSTKSKDEKHVKKEEKSKASQTKSKTSDNNAIPKSNKNLPQVDGIDDSCISSDSELDNIMQVDGNDDNPNTKTRSLRSTRAKKIEAANANKAEENESVSPPKRSKKELHTKTNITTERCKSPKRKLANNNIGAQSESEHSNKNDLSSKSLTKSSMPMKNLEVPKSPVSKGIKQDRKGKSPERINANKGKGDHSESVSKIKTNDNGVTSKSIKSNTSKKPELSKSPQKKNDKSNKDVSVNLSATNKTVKLNTIKSPKSLSLKTTANDGNFDNMSKGLLLEKVASPRKTRINNKIPPQEITTSNKNKTVAEPQNKKDLSVPKILITDESKETTESKYFAIKGENSEQETKGRSTRKRSHTEVVNGDHQEQLDVKTKTRTRSVPGSKTQKSKYFDDTNSEPKKSKLSLQKLKLQEKIEDAQRVSHRGLTKSKAKPKNDVTGDLVNIIKGRIKGAKEEAKKGIVKGKVKKESDDDSDYLPVEDVKPRDSESDEDFKPTKISPKATKLNPGARPSTSKSRLDRRVLSSEDDAIMSRKVNVWCEIFVEELEQWIAVDVIKGKVHCTNDFYSQATHPVCYVVGWDNNNYLKDLTRRYVPHWNTVTRKQRAEPEWWKTAVQPWLGPRNARDREEDESLDRMQLEAPLPKSIAEYKNHPLYALKRHLLKYEALYPPDAATLGFVRNEPVYARECVYTCRSRDTWLKEAKVVKLGQSPYKVVKARPKWDRLSNKLITDKPLEIFGPWQVQDYEPPTAENGIVPRNAYGNVELFKDCMLPKGTVHVKLPGLNKVARKLNIDCAPAMTGFDFNGGWSHPVYDGFVVCKEYEEIITEAWIKDQEEQERKEIEKMELRVYGNWRRLIKGLLIRERLKHKYGFEKPSTSQPAKNKKGPRLVCKKIP